MNNSLQKLARHYAMALRRYLRKGHESDLEKAYELGREALARELGVLDMAKVHQEALENLFPSEEERRTLKAAETFFLETLSPFEATHRGFGETNGKLWQASATVEKRNRELKAEIIERKRTERALQMSETRLLAILENSPAIIFLKDAHGRYLHVNRQFERQFGLSRNEVLGRTDEHLFPPGQAAAFRDNDRMVLLAGNPLEFEESASYNDGDHVSIVSKFPLRDTKGEIYALCGIATDITQRKQMEDALRRSEEHYRLLLEEAQMMQENLRNLSNQILHAQEAERKRISLELHDEVGQALTGISMNLESLKKIGATKSSLMIRKFTDTQSLLQQTMDTVHRFARELRPAMLDELGLLPALRSYLKGFAERTGLRVHFRGNPIAEKLGGDQKTVLFRVAQESLTNTSKHAHASQVDVTLCKHYASLCMEVVDNGRSFDADVMNAARSKKQRLGLLGMQERVRLVHGEFTIIPRPGQGTTVRVVIPFGPGIASLPLHRMRNRVNHKNHSLRAKLNA